MEKLLIMCEGPNEKEIIKIIEYLSRSGTDSQNR